MNRYLVIARCGRSSLHLHWLSGAEDRNWDLVVCPYQDIEPQPSSLTSTDVIPGQKWSGLFKLLSTWNEWRKYQYIWLPDDDLATDVGTINAFFELSELFDSKLSAPALSEDSYFAHPITMQNKKFYARAVSFIEVMMPCFRRDILEKLYPTIGKTASGFGWGLDTLWPYLIGYEDIIIFDYLTVRHTRPGGRDPTVTKIAGDEMRELLKEMNVQANYGKTLGAYTNDRSFIAADHGPFLIDYLVGYRYLVERKQDYLKYFYDQQRTLLPKLPAYVGDPRRGENVALNRPALVSSVSEWSRSSDPAVEARGANNGILTGGCGFHTSFELFPWWQVDLGEIVDVRCIAIFNRLDLAYRCKRIRISSSDGCETWITRAEKLDDQLFGGADGKPFIFVFDPPFADRYVRITSLEEGFLHLDEVEIFSVKDKYR